MISVLSHDGLFYAEDRRIAKDGGEVRIHTGYALLRAVRGFGKNKIICDPPALSPARDSRRPRSRRSHLQTHWQRVQLWSALRRAQQRAPTGPNPSSV
jgi:hypothetical protein